MKLQISLKLFNTLDKKIKKINISLNKTFNIYLCGPTVYDHIHIGNLRSVIIFDVLYRFLSYLNFKVKYVQNITDIDDKIILKAQQKKKTEKQISDYYVDSYFQILTGFNVLFPDYSPKVTNYIPQIKCFIDSLLKKNIAYYRDKEIIFRTRKLKKYGKLSGQKLENLEKKRKTVQIFSKENENDFILWKETDQGLNWYYNNKLGRPGWHTECVVFIKELFNNETIDIHGGGNDLLFPHHENERIQFLAYNDNNKELSKIWLHVAHINFKKEKMSKSLGNIIYADFFLNKYGSNVLHHLILKSQYNQIIEIDEILIQQSVNYIKKIENFLKRVSFYFYVNNIFFIKKEEKNSKTIKELFKLLTNNLNTAKIFSLLENSISFINKKINEKEKKGKKIVKKVNEVFFILEILGFKFNFNLLNYDINTKLLIKKWENFIEKKIFFEADKIRDQLQKLGII